MHNDAMKRHLTIDAQTCTGCGACVRKCPARAIGWVVGDDGFPAPRIDEGKCVGCGLCLSVCQLLRPKSSNSVLGAFAVQAEDRGILAESTSGGAFTALAATVLDGGGVVYGCVFDDSCTAVYARATSSRELAPMRGSKYVWADASGCFADVRADVDAGRNVLFCALPCQVSGLQLFLGRDCPNLVTMDLLCAGPPSPAVFDAYLDTLVPRGARKGLDFKFREKTANGPGYCIAYRRNGKTEHVSRAMSSYLYLFMEKIVLRKSCYRCRHRGIHREADLTVGDFWGAKTFFPDWDSKAGLSFVLANSPKGLALFQEAARKCRVAPTRVGDIARRNILCTDDSVENVPPPSGREGFFSLFNSWGYNVAALRYALTVKRLKAMVADLIRKKKARS